MDGCRGIIILNECVAFHGRSSRCGDCFEVFDGWICLEREMMVSLMEFRMNSEMQEESDEV